MSDDDFKVALNIYFLFVGMFEKICFYWYISLLECIV